MAPCINSGPSKSLPGTSKKSQRLFQVPHLSVPGVPAGGFNRQQIITPGGNFDMSHVPHLSTTGGPPDPRQFRNTKESDKIVATGGSTNGWGLVWVWALRQKHGHRGSTGGSTAPKRVSGAPWGGLNMAPVAHRGGCGKESKLYRGYPAGGGCSRLRV